MHVFSCKRLIAPSLPLNMSPLSPRVTFCCLVFSSRFLPWQISSLPNSSILLPLTPSQCLISSASHPPPIPPFFCFSLPPSCLPSSILFPVPLFPLSVVFYSFSRHLGLLLCRLSSSNLTETKAELAFSPRT